MKRLALVLVMTLACCVTSYAQLQLKSGDVFVCQFTTLGNPGNSFGPPARGQFATYGTLQPASELRYEIFENNTGDPVLCSGSFSEPRTNVYLGGCQSLGAWQDFQGVVRLTMLKGTAEIKYLYFAAGIPTGTSFRSYEAYVFLPSPTYTLTVSNNGLGSVSPSGSIFGGGDPVIALTATPSNDWEFVNWSGDASGDANPLNVAMTTNKFIIANFAQGPTIFSQPQSTIFSVGDTVSFSVKAGGVPPLVYQWYFNGSAIPAMTNPILTLGNVQLSQQGGYSVIVTNRYGMATSEVATLAVGVNAVTVCDEAKLREAIAQGAKVTFACDGTITLTNTITISADTILDGAGHSVTISGNNTVRLFNVNTGVTFTVLNLTLADGRHKGATSPVGTTRATNGEPAFGGAIFNAGGTVNIVNSVLTNNAAYGGDGDGRAAFPPVEAQAGTGSGGAIYNQSGRISVMNSTLAGNLAIGGIAWHVGHYGTNALGGAICNLDGIVSLVDVTFAANSAIGGGDSNYFALMFGAVSGNAFGGAVFTSGGSVFSSNVTFHANNAQAPRLNWNGTAGAACGGALYISNSIVHLRRGVLSSNTVLGGSNYRSVGGPGQGGAIYNQGQLLLREVLLAGNRADGGGGYYEAAEGEGGALYTVNSTIIDACAFSDNTARGGDGGVRQVFPGPGGHGNGGAIYSAGMLRVTNSTVASNQAIGGNGAIGEFRAEPGGSANGGGIYSTAGTLTLTYATLARNSAIGGMGGMGGAWVPSGPNGAGSGGGVFNTNGTVTLVNTIIANSPSGSNCFGVVNDGGGNISSDGSCNFSALGSLNNTDPVLGPLGDYGGQTPTMPLLAGSPAIDRAISALCPRTDQRGVARPTGGGCDIGAFESGSVFSIRGRVSGWGLGPGLLVESTTSSTVTDANGNYMFDLLTAGTYAVLPFQPGWLFVPDLRVVTVGPDAPGMDFKGYRLNYLSPEPSSNAIYHYVFAGTNGDVHEIQVSTNLVNWQTIATNTVDANGIFEFFFTNNAFAERMRFLRTKKQP